MSNSFHIVVTSDASTKQNPENKVASFTMQLPNQLHLSEDWEVAMKHINYLHAWQNVQQNQVSTVKLSRWFIMKVTKFQKNMWFSQVFSWLSAVIMNEDQGNDSLNDGSSERRHCIKGYFWLSNWSRNPCGWQPLQWCFGEYAENGGLNWPTFSRAAWFRSPKNTLNTGGRGKY